MLNANVSAFAVLFFSMISAATTLKDLNSLKAPYKLPSLPYAENSLSAAVDTETMKIHHGKHHQSYVDNLNKVAGSEKNDLLNVLTTISKRPDAVRNNAGGHWNHSFFWTVMTPTPEMQKMSKTLTDEINAAFGSVDKLKEEMQNKGATQFGSGWVWLIRNKAGKLQVTTTSNQDNPMMDTVADRGVPVFGIDVWEHAYYLKYQNKRADYLKSFWNIVNWKQVEAYNQEAKAMKL